MKYPTTIDNIYNCYIRDISILVRNTLSIFRSRIFGYFIQVGTLALYIVYVKQKNLWCGFARTKNSLSLLSEPGANSDGLHLDI